MGDVVPMPRGLSEEQHTEDHRLIEEVRPLLVEFLEDRKRASELREKFKQSMVGAIAVALVGGISTALVWIGQQVITILQSGRHP